MEFKDKVVVITGSSRGIGRAIAVSYAKLGANVVVNYHKNDRDANMTKLVIESYGVKCLLCKADVSKENEVKNMFNKVMHQFHKVDILINNAGIVYDIPFEERTVGHWTQTLNTNLVAMFITSKIFGEELKKSEMPSIVNISSTNGINSTFSSSLDYDASKAGIISLTKNLAEVFAPKINVNCVAPSWVETEMNIDLPLSLIEEETNKILLKRFAQPEEIANVVVFLTSNKARYITAQTICVDGGLR